MLNGLHSTLTLTLILTNPRILFIQKTLEIPFRLNSNDL